ncbi:penicillin-insensitive murein endopeptidase [Ancylobacter sonchi]|uniref:penicillin-insensitive murein endopeptidase n=1 Tax=Ancylobacter sonchi TaxID=1937790 RepID=UPI001BD25B43|nr:penicillin-insensitive murein endopeptidase [Ancylobacter sonchi]MBS7532227.1 penicillin-insensitive murein endopeptidase [Ancylobacter sonchi]
MRRLLSVLALAGLALAGVPGASHAQEDAPPPAAKPAAAGATPAKVLFGAVKQPASGLAPRAIGFYSRGCLAGGEALPVTGPTWQAMRLSRNRNWGHPDLIAFLERLAAQAPKVGWSGLLVGDMAQPRGGPMATGHASHQIGLDADIWLTPMPRKVFTAKEREDVSATMIVRPDRLDVDAQVWTPAHVAIIRAAAQDDRVERVLVNAAIKKALCRDARGDRSWLQKVRPYWGHDYHMHVRISCPAGSPDCRPQDAVVPGDGCDKLDWWFSDGVLHPKPPKVPPKPAPPVTLADLPPSCTAVLKAQ